MNLGPARPVAPASEMSKYKKKEIVQSPIMRVQGNDKCLYQTGILVNTKDLQQKRTQSACDITVAKVEKEKEPTRESAGCLTYAHLGVVRPRLPSNNFYAPSVLTVTNNAKHIAMARVLDQ